MLDPMTVAAVGAETKIKWTPELVETVRKLREAGYKSTDIAKQLGTTPNSILGIAHRQKMGRLRDGTKQIRWTLEVLKRARELWDARVPGPTIADKLGCTLPALWRACHRYKFPHRYTTRLRRRSDWHRPKLTSFAKPSPVRVNSADLAIPIEQRCSIMDLSEATCRWPVGDPQSSDFFYCGAAPLKGRPYCPAHCMRAYGRYT